MQKAFFAFYLVLMACDPAYKDERRVLRGPNFDPVIGVNADGVPAPESAVKPEEPSSAKGTATPLPEWPELTLQKPFPGDTYGCKPPYPTTWSCNNVVLNNVGQGSLLSALRPEAKYLVAAPHGWFDAGTDAIAYSLFPKDIPARYPVWNQLIAHSFRGNAPSGLQHNVNRPSTLTNDTCTNPPDLVTSKMVYELYKERMDLLVQSPALYFEIHGQSEPGLENSLEAATARISAAEAEKVRTIMKEELARAGITGITVVIEPVDKIFFNAIPTKDCGSIQHIAPGPAIHTEIPAVLRTGDAAQVKTAKFYRALLTRLALEVFPPTRKPLAEAATTMLLDVEAIPARFTD